MKQKIKADMKTAMKAKDKVALETLRSLLSAIQYTEMQKETEDLSEEELIAILKNESKKRTEAIEYAEKAARDDEKQKLLAELAVIETFLPEQLGENELEKIITEMRTENEGLNMGLAMKQLKERFAGQYDGKLASSIAKRMLG